MGLEKGPPPDWPPTADVARTSQTISRITRSIVSNQTVAPLPEDARRSSLELRISLRLFSLTYKTERRRDRSIRTGRRPARQGNARRVGTIGLGVVTVLGVIAQIYAIFPITP